MNNAAGADPDPARAGARSAWPLANGNLSLNGQALTLLSDASGTALVDNTGRRGAGQHRHHAAPHRNQHRPPTATATTRSPVAGETVTTLATAGYTPDFSGAAAYNSSATPGTGHALPHRVRLQPGPHCHGHVHLQPL